MNKDAFDAGLAALQAQLDAADRALSDAKATLDAARAAYRAAKADLAGHVAYGKCRGWIAPRARHRNGATGGIVRPGTARTDILAVLSVGPASIDDLFDASEASRPSLYTNLARLRKEGIVVREGGVYSLAEPVAVEAAE